MSAYIVSRNGQDLGSFEASQILEGLQSGSFLSTDWLWQDGMSDWKPVSDVFPQAQNPAAMPVRAAAPMRAVVPRANPAASVPRTAAVAGSQRVAAKTNPYESPVATESASPARAGGMVPQSTIAELAGTRPWVLLVSVIMWIGAGVSLIGVVLFLLLGIAGAGAMAKTGNPAAAGGLVVSSVMMLVAAGLIIYPTLKLTKYATGIGRLVKTRSFHDLELVLGEQRRFWKFYGIMILVYIAMVLVSVLLAVVSGAMLAAPMAK